ncbi:unnamed protein product [Heterobilharzia americana]|nr:unnamed protein product [Heterobilharzia americana]
MNFFPAPFSLGTSDMLVTDILPVNVEECPQDVEKSIVSCQVGNVLYTSKLKSTLRDSNYATVIYNKKKKTVEVIHKKPEFLEPCFDDDVIEVPNALKADRAALINAFGSVKKQRAMREIERNKTHKDSMTNAQVIDRAMHGQARLKSETETNGICPEKDMESSNSQVDERLRLLPPIDLKATCPENVYPYEKLVPARVAEALSSEVQQITSLDSNSIDDLLSGHVYPQWRDLMRKVPLPDTPSSVMKLLLSQFTALVNRQGMGRQKVRVISPMLRDKLITHMLILVLHCDSFKQWLTNWLLISKLDVID